MWRSRLHWILDWNRNLHRPLVRVVPNVSTQSGHIKTFWIPLTPTINPTAYCLCNSLYFRHVGLQPLILSPFTFNAFKPPDCLPNHQTWLHVPTSKFSIQQSCGSAFAEESLSCFEQGGYRAGRDEKRTFTTQVRFWFSVLQGSVRFEYLLTRLEFGSGS